MVPLDPKELADAIQAALARTRTVCKADEIAVTLTRSLPTEQVTMGASLLGRLIDCVDDVSKTHGSLQ